MGTLTQALTCKRALPHMHSLNISNVDILTQQQQWLPGEEGIKDSTPWPAFRTGQGSPLQAIPVSLLNSPCFNI